VGCHVTRDTIAMRPTDLERLDAPYPAPPYTTRTQQATEAKSAIAEAAARLVQDGRLVLMDGGSTTVHAVLDEASLCHVGFVVEGRRVVIPTAFGRDGERLYLHGAPLSRMLTTLEVQRQPPRRHRQSGSGQR